MGPWDLRKRSIFRVSSVKLRDSHLRSMCIKVFWKCGRTEEACSMVVRLRMVDISHPNGQNL